MKQLFLALILFITILGCDDTKTKYEIVCEGVECSEHGECTVKEDRKAVCVCDKNFHAEGLECKANTLQCGVTEHEEAGACVSNHKMVDCIDVTPTNATTMNIQTEITWENGTWSNASNCEWYCNENYHKSGNTCVENTLQCEDNQHEEENGCVDNTKTVDCNNVTPEHGVKVDSQVQITWENGVWSNTDNCDFTCETGYNKVGGSCVEDNQNDVSNLRVENITDHSCDVLWDGNPNAKTWVYVHSTDTTGPQHDAVNNKYSYLSLGSGLQFTVYVQGDGSDLVLEKEFTTLNALVCEADSCTELHKTVCSVESNQIVCSCDEGYHDESGTCIQNSITPQDPQYTPTYYVDASNGNDSNDGHSATHAWKTLTKVSSYNFVAGDVIAFKRGEIWKGNLRILSSGTEEEYITLTAYGTGARPIIDANDDFATSWSLDGSHGEHIYKSPLSLHVYRLWRNGIEQKSTTQSARLLPQRWTEMGNNVGCNWHWEDGYLWFYSESGPPLGQFSGMKYYTTVNISNKNYVRISGLDIRGGGNSIAAQGTEHCVIEYCNIGYNASIGIGINDTRDLKINRVVFDSNFKLNFVGTESYSGADARGCNEGVVSYRNTNDCEISHSNFINWTHAGIAFSCGSSTCENNHIHHNYFTAPDLTYARAFGYSGTGMQNNEFDHNYIHKFYLRCQINGQNNHVHHNVINDIHDTPIKSGEEGQGFAFESYAGLTTGNIVEYNTFIDIDSAGISLIATSGHVNLIQGNTLRKNLFINCGRNPSTFAWTANKGITTTNYEDIGANTFTDNAFADDGDTVYHNGVECTPEEFNQRNGIGGDTISGNTSTVTDQGAGDLDLSMVGVDASE